MTRAFSRDEARQAFRIASMGYGRAGTADMPDGPYMSIDDAADVYARLATSSPDAAGSGGEAREAEKWRHKLWMVACHATGGGIPEIEGIDASVNDICVQITQSRNMIYQAGKDAAITPDPLAVKPIDATQTREAELVAALERARDALFEARGGLIIYDGQVTNPSSAEGWTDPDGFDAWSAITVAYKGALAALNGRAGA